MNASTPGTTRSEILTARSPLVNDSYLSEGVSLPPFEQHSLLNQLPKSAFPSPTEPGHIMHLLQGAEPGSASSNISGQINPQTMPTPPPQSPQHGRKQNGISQNQLKRSRSTLISSPSRQIIDSTQDPEPLADSQDSSDNNDGSRESSSDSNHDSAYPQRETPRGEAPRTEDGKYACGKCDIKPFNRRCEWK